MLIIQPELVKIITFVNKVFIHVKRKTEYFIISLLKLQLMLNYNILQVF